MTWPGIGAPGQGVETAKHLELHTPWKLNTDAVSAPVSCTICRHRSLNPTLNLGGNFGQRQTIQSLNPRPRRTSLTSWYRMIVSAHIPMVKTADPAGLASTTDAVA